MTDFAYVIDFPEKVLELIFAMQNNISDEFHTFIIIYVVACNEISVW